MSKRLGRPLGRTNAFYATPQWRAIESGLLSKGFDRLAVYVKKESHPTHTLWMASLLAHATNCDLTDKAPPPHNEDCRGWPGFSEQSRDKSLASLLEFMLESPDEKIERLAAAMHDVEHDTHVDADSCWNKSDESHRNLYRELWRRRSP